MDLAKFESDRLQLFADYGFYGESRRVADPEGRLTYTISRGEEPCPTILIHGGMSEASEWSLLAGKLPGQVVIPDRPGCGLSYSIDYGSVGDFRGAAANWLLDLLDGIGADQVNLVGGSIGGYFAMAFSAAHPERVQHLLLMGAPPGLDRTAVPLFIRLLGNPIIGPLLGKMTTTDPEAFRKRVLPNLVANPNGVPVELIRIMIAAESIPGAVRTSHTMLRAWFTLWGTRPHMMIRDDIEGLRVPTLFAWGDRDSFVPPSVGQEVASAMPSARVEVIAEAGHIPYLDHPDAIAEVITKFIAHDNG